MSSSTYHLGSGTYRPKAGRLPARIKPIEESSTPPRISCSDLEPKTKSYLEPKTKRGIYDFLQNNPDHPTLKLNTGIKITFKDKSDVIEIDDDSLKKMGNIVGSYKGVPLTLIELLIIMCNEELFNSLISEEIEAKDKNKVKDVFEDHISFENAIDAQIENWQHWGCLIPVDNSSLCQISLINHENYCQLLQSVERESSGKVKCPFTRKDAEYRGKLQNLLAIVKILVDKQDGAEKSKTSVKRDFTLKTMLLEDGILKKGLFDSNSNLVCGEIWNTKQNKLITTRFDGHDFQHVADGVYRVKKIGENKCFYTSSLDPERKVEGVKHIQEHDKFTYFAKFLNGDLLSFCYTDDSKVINAAYNENAKCYYFIESKNNDPSLAGLEFKMHEGGLDLSKKCPEGVKISGYQDINVPTGPEQISDFRFSGDMINGKIEGYGHVAYNNKIICGMFQNGEFVSGIYNIEGSRKETKICMVDPNKRIYIAQICEGLVNWQPNFVVYVGENYSVFNDYSLLNLEYYNGYLKFSLGPLSQNDVGFSGYDGSVVNGELSSGALNLNDGSSYEGNFNNSFFSKEGLLTINSVTYKVLGSLESKNFFRDNNLLFFRVENQNSGKKIASFNSSGKVSLVNADSLRLSQEFMDGAKITYYGSIVGGDLSGKKGVLYSTLPRISLNGDFTNGLPYDGTITLQTDSNKKEYIYKIKDKQLIYWSKENKKHIMDLSGVEVSRCLPMSKKRKSRELMILEFFKRAENAFGLSIQSNSVSATLGYA
jgi:hypothetical protein